MSSGNNYIIFGVISDSLHFSFFGLIVTDSHNYFFAVFFFCIIFEAWGKSKCYQEFADVEYNKFVLTTMMSISVYIILGS